MKSKFGFLTKYSFLKKVKSKGFIIGNIIVFIILAALVNIDSIVNYFGGDFSDTTKVMIVDNYNCYNELKNQINNNSELLDQNIRVYKEKDTLKEAKKKLKDTKNILLIINRDEKNIINVKFISDSYVDTIVYQTIITSLDKIKYEKAVKELNLSSDDLAKLSSSVEVKRIFINKDKNKDEEDSKSILTALSMIFVVPSFILMIYLVQMIGAEINEEKSTRGMEIIIGNVPVKTHFFSKILASNLFVLMQGVLLLLYSGFGLVIRKLTTKSSDLVSSVSEKVDVSNYIEVVQNSGIIDKLSYMIPLILILIILSFLAYSLLAGILASVTTNMENFQQLQTPLMVISVIGYYLITISVMFPGATFMKVMSVIPLISISLAPSLLLSSQIGATTVIIAILILALLDYLLVRYGLRIYKVGILNYSETGLWKKMFKAIKQK